VYCQKPLRRRTGFMAKFRLGKICLPVIQRSIPQVPAWLESQPASRQATCADAPRGELYKLCTAVDRPEASAISEQNLMSLKAVSQAVRTDPTTLTLRPCTGKRPHPASPDSLRRLMPRTCLSVAVAIGFIFKPRDIKGAIAATLKGKHPQSTPQ